MKNLIRELGLTEDEIKKIILNSRRSKPKILKHHLSDLILKFGVVADTHLCSVEEKINELHTFYSICKKQGVKIVLHAGDLLSGWKIYKGQENEVHTFGAKNQAEYAIKNYPHIKGIQTYFINGNHDEAWWKLAGIDTGELISAERKDMTYLGFYSNFVILNGIKIQLQHGDGGGAYALSYKGQKFAESIPSGRKPDVLLIGHYHTAFYFWYRNIHIFNCGCFEGQTSFLKRKMLNPALGGWIVTLRISEPIKGKKTKVLACEQSWIPFF